MKAGELDELRLAVAVMAARMLDEPGVLDMEVIDHLDDDTRKPFRDVISPEAWAERAAYLALWRGADVSADAQWAERFCPTCAAPLAHLLPC